MPIIEGTTRTLNIVGVPVNGTDAVFTLTFGATISSGTFILAYDGYRTGAITWSSTNNTLVQNIQDALDALPSGGGSGSFVVAAGTIVAGVNGTVTITASGAAAAKTLLPALTVFSESLVGAASTLVASYSTSGVTASYRNCGLGTLVCDNSASGKLYKNTSATIGAPTWTAQT